MSGAVETGAVETGALDSAEYDQATNPPGRLRTRRTVARSGLEWAVVISLAVAVALLVRHFVVQSYSIPSPSMAPTLRVDDRLLVTKVNYLWGDVARGDMIVFHKPPAMKAEDEIDDLVKRVIGLPGDTVEAKGGRVFVNGAPLQEPWLPADTPTSDWPATLIPLDEYFVLGDNRGNSLDSRFWGTVRRDQIVGKVFVRIWPLGRVGVP